MMRNLPEIVDAMAMVSMVVSDDNMIDVNDIGSQQLLAQVGATIDEHSFAVAVDHDR